MIWTSFSFNFQWLVNTHHILGSNKKWLVYSSYWFCSWSRQWNSLSQENNFSQIAKKAFRLLYWSLFTCVISCWKKFRRSSSSRGLSLPNFLLLLFLYCLHSCLLLFCGCGFLFFFFKYLSFVRKIFKYRIPF